MVKKIALAVLIGFLLLFSYLQSRYISTAYQVLTEAAAPIGACLQQHDVQKTNESIAAFGDVWEENADTWMSLIPHEHVDTVYQSYLMMKECALQGDLRLAAVYLRQLEYALKDVRNMDSLHIRNIF